MNNLKTIIEKKDSQIRVLSPSVGFCSLATEPEKYLSAGACIGKLIIMNTNMNLYLPADVFGKVIIEETRDNVFPVEYNQLLFR